MFSRLEMKYPLEKSSARNMQGETVWWVFVDMSQRWRHQNKVENGNWNELRRAGDELHLQSSSGLVL